MKPLFTGMSFPCLKTHRSPSSLKWGSLNRNGWFFVSSRSISGNFYIRWFFRWYPEIPLSAQNRWYPWICFFGDVFNGESTMGWKSPSNHQLREYVCNFLQASNKQVQVMLYPEVCRMVPASPCWWINVSMLLEYLLRMVPWKYLMQLGKDQIWLLGQVEGGPSHHLEVGWNNYTFIYICIHL